MLWHSESLAQAVVCGQQLCLMHVSHGESSVLAGQASPPPLLEPELLEPELEPPLEHCDVQLSAAQVSTFVASWFCWRH
jgi:hypothetical protein